MINPNQNQLESKSFRSLFYRRKSPRNCGGVISDKLCHEANKPCGSEVTTPPDSEFELEPK